MPSEMISGPDLGGGYLHQLSIDRAENRTTFTFHAQEGGSDANGPPLGPLEPFGFTHPPNPCQFGGPKCWHRRFLLPFAETSKVRQAYNRSRFVLDTMLKQRFGGHPVGADEALVEVVKRIEPIFSREGILWYVGGSMAARLLGADLTPNDIDLGTTRSGVDRLGELLVEYLIEPVAPTDWPSSGIVRGARAFVGTFRDGARVEWAIPIDPDSVRPFEEWSGDPKQTRLLTASFHGRSLRVTRPEYALVRAAELGAAGRLETLLALIRKVGADPELLEALLARSSLRSAASEAIARRVRD